MAFHRTRGFSLMDVIVGTALLLIVFMALFGMLRASIALTAAAKARAGATSLASEQMEYARSLTYVDTGTVGGIPAGVIEEEVTRILNGRTYTVRTFVQYVDDPADGLGADDETGIVTDYKKIKVDVAYTVANRQQNVFLVSNRTPKGIETAEGGGNLRISVTNALGDPVSSAQVHIQNSLTNPAVDLTTFTGNDGAIFLPGADPSTGYRVTVSKSEYSTAQTYDQNSENVSPTPGHLTVSEAETTQGTFAIDVLSSLRVQTWEPIRDNYVEDTFFTNSKISSASSTEVVSGALVLTNESGTYTAEGFARSTSTSPTYLSSWNAFHATTTLPAGTSVTYRFYYDNAGTPTRIPEVDLTGNEAGFTTTPVDLSALATSTYDTIYVDASLATNDVATTPSIDAWRLTYAEGPIPIPDVSVTLAGSKTIGQDGGGNPIKKHVHNFQTGASGWYELLNIEWDTYAFSVTGYDVAELCNPDVLNINPNTSNTINAYLESDTTHSLRVVVRDDLGGFIEDANVELSRTGYAATGDTTGCGQTYFGGVQSENDYVVTVSKDGYVTELVGDIIISGDAKLDVVLTTS